MLKFGLKSKCFALVAAALMAGGVSAADKIRVASEGTFAPFEFMNSKTGQLEGFEIDLVKALCAKMGKEPEITMYKFDGILPAVLSNTVDFAAAGFAITEERKKKVLFTDPFYKSGITVILPAKSDLKIEKFEDLKGKSISVQMGSISHDKAKTIPDARITTFDQSPDAILNMIQGGSDAAINSLASTDYMIGRHLRQDPREVVRPSGHLEQDAREVRLAVVVGAKTLNGVPSRLLFDRTPGCDRKATCRPAVSGRFRSRLDRFDHAAGIADGDDVLRNGAGDDAACPDHAVASDRDARKQNGAAADPDAVFDFDGARNGSAEAFARNVFGDEALGKTRRVRPRIDLHVGGDEDVVPDVDAVVVDERAVHVDHDVVADEDVAAEFAMKINVEMNALSHVSEEFAHQALFFCDVVQLPQKLSRATDHSEKVGVLPSDEGFACEALFVFRGHDSSLHLREHEATGEGLLSFSLQKRRFQSAKFRFAFSYERPVPQ